VGERDFSGELGVRRYSPHRVFGGKIKASKEGTFSGEIYVLRERDEERERKISASLGKHLHGVLPVGGMQKDKWLNDVVGDAIRKGKEGGGNKEMLTLGPKSGTRTTSKLR